MTTTKDTIVLARGAHPANCDDPQRCFFEWYNWIARKIHDDGRPPGVSWVLHRLGMRLNDLLPDEKRQELADLLPNGGPSPLDGTENDGLDVTRAYMAADWAIRTCTPMWLDRAGLTEEAQSLRGLVPVTDPATAGTAAAAARATRDASWKARGAAIEQLRARFAPRAVAAAVVAADAADVAADWGSTYRQVYDHLRSAAVTALAPVAEQTQTSVIALYRAMIRPEAG